MGKAPRVYAERYGAAYGNFVHWHLYGSAILPSILKQDPRYFYKGTGKQALANSKCSRPVRDLQRGIMATGRQITPASLEASPPAGISNIYYAPKIAMDWDSLLKTR